MPLQIDSDSIKKSVEDRLVVDILNEVNNRCSRWNKGGALIHRVRAFGGLAESGADNISNGRTPINKNSTFKNMRQIDKKMYDQTLNFLYLLAEAGIYSP